MFFFSCSYYFAETSMDPDVFGAYNKQHIESLTTDGDGETKLFKDKTCTYTYYYILLMKCKKINKNHKNDFGMKFCYGK